MASNLSEVQKLMLFEQATRQNKIPTETIQFTENGRKTIILPKSRTLANISLLVSGSFTLTHATKTTYTAKTFSKEQLLKKISLKVNNNFAPYNISGAGLKLYNLQRQNKAVTDNRNVHNYITNTVSTTGATNSLSFMLDLPLVINERDFIGLINLQGEGVNLALEFDFGSVSDIMTDTDITISNVDISITPILETFSIPPLKEHTPSFNTIKVVTEQTQPVPNVGDVTIKMPIGLTYRKILLYMKQDGNYTPISMSRIGNISLILNQADFPYILPAEYIASVNSYQNGDMLPEGAYSFDFSNNGIANYGSGRDYLDSENLSEMWVRSSFKSLSGATNEILVISEQIAEI